MKIPVTASYYGAQLFSDDERIRNDPELEFITNNFRRSYVKLAHQLVLSLPTFTALRMKNFFFPCTSQAEKILTSQGKAPMLLLTPPYRQHIHTPLGSINYPLISDLTQSSIPLAQTLLTSARKVDKGNLLTKLAPYATMSTISFHLPGVTSSADVHWAVAANHLRLLTSIDVVKNGSISLNTAIPSPILRQFYVQYRFPVTVDPKAVSSLFDPTTSVFTVYAYTESSVTPSDSDVVKTLIPLMSKARTVEKDVLEIYSKQRLLPKHKMNVELIAPFVSENGLVIKPSMESISTGKISKAQKKLLSEREVYTKILNGMEVEPVFDRMFDTTLGVEISIPVALTSVFKDEISEAFQVAKQSGMNIPFSFPYVAEVAQESSISEDNSGSKAKPKNKKNKAKTKKCEMCYIEGIPCVHITKLDETVENIEEKVEENVKVSVEKVEPITTTIQIVATKSETALGDDDKENLPTLAVNQAIESKQTTTNTKSVHPREMEKKKDEAKIIEVPKRDQIEVQAADDGIVNEDVTEDSSLRPKRTRGCRGGRGKNKNKPKVGDNVVGSDTVSEVLNENGLVKPVVVEDVTNVNVPNKNVTNSASTRRATMQRPREDSISLHVKKQAKKEAVVRQVVSTQTPDVTCHASMNEKMTKTSKNESRNLANGTANGNIPAMSSTVTKKGRVERRGQLDKTTARRSSPTSTGFTFTPSENKRGKKQQNNESDASGSVSTPSSSSPMTASMKITHRSPPIVSVSNSSHGRFASLAFLEDEGDVEGDVEGDADIEDDITKSLNVEDEDLESDDMFVSPTSTPFNEVVQVDRFKEEEKEKQDLSVLAGEDLRNTGPVLKPALRKVSVYDTTQLEYLETSLNNFTGGLLKKNVSIGESTSVIYIDGTTALERLIDHSDATFNAHVDLPTPQDEIAKRREEEAAREALKLKQEQEKIEAQKAWKIAHGIVTYPLLPKKLHRVKATRTAPSFNYSQQYDHLNIVLGVRGVIEFSSKVTFHSRSIDFELAMPSPSPKKVFTIELERDIVPAKCSTQYNLVNIVVHVVKAEAEVWNDISPASKTNKSKKTSKSNTKDSGTEATETETEGETETEADTTEAEIDTGAESA